MPYEQIFFWIGIVSSAFFVLLGMGLAASLLMNFLWGRMRDAHGLMTMIEAYRELNRKRKADVA